MKVLDHSSTRLQAVLNKHEDDEEARATDVLKYYLDNFPEVYVLICDKCKKKLAIEYVDPNKPNLNHHQSRQVIPIDGDMKSYRARLDGTMGYKCSCGNDTRLGKAEQGIVPVVRLLKNGNYELPSTGMEIHPHHYGLVQENLKVKKLQPKMSIQDKDFIIETFRVRRIK